MLYFFYGIDSKKASDKANTLINKMLEKKPDVSLFVIDDENFSRDLFQEMTQSIALFQNKYIIHVKRILDTKDFEDTILKLLKEIKESENIFIWDEGEVKKSTISKIEKFAERIVNVGGAKEEYQGKKIFGICNPIISRDKKTFWAKYQELLEDFPVEELHGTIFWQFKNIAIASRANQKDSGLTTFPYNNAKKALNNYSEEEILKKTSELSKIVHEARSGGAELEIALEKFVLNL